MVRLFLVVQMPDARDKRRVTVTPGPLDGFLLRLESRQHMVGMVLDDIVVDRIALPPGLWTWFDIDVCHCGPPFGSWFFQSSSASRGGRVRVLDLHQQSVRTERVERTEPLRDEACQEWLFQYLMEINGKRTNCGIVSNASGDGKAQKLNTLMLKR
jgi:hypothetical protein